MTMRFLLVPVVDRTLLRTVLSRCDQIMGYPRTHAASEPGVTGTPYTETLFAVFFNASTGTVAVMIDDFVTALASRFVEHNSVRKRLSQWVTDQGWTVTTARPANPQNWVRVAARDGGTGSVDGVPIAEGAE